MKESKFLLYLLGISSIIMGLFGFFIKVSPYLWIGLPGCYFIGIFTGYTIHKFDEKKGV